MKYIITLLLLILSVPAGSNPVPDFPFIILAERLEKHVEPDVVQIKFNLIAYAAKSDESLELLREAGKRVLSLLKKYEIPLASLESTHIDKRVKRARTDRVYNLDILGYETTQTLNLKLNDLIKYPALLNDLIAIDGVARVNSLFGSVQEDEIKEGMIKELSEKTRRKADALAKAQSRTVKKVYGITTERSFGEAYAIFSLQYEPSIYASAANSAPYDRDLTMMVPEYIVLHQGMTAIYELK